MADGLTVALATTAISTSLGAFYQIMPPIAEVRTKSDSDPTFRANVRVSEALAAFIALGVGGSISALTGNNVPLALSAVFAAAMIGFYEYTLRTDRLMEAV